MRDFWSMPYCCKVAAPDSGLARLEAMAEQSCPSGWGVEFDGDRLHFRFVDEGERGVFAWRFLAEAY